MLRDTRVVSDGAEEEVVDVVDDRDEVVRQATRSEVFTRRLRHRSVAVLCRNEHDEIFVHRRTRTKRVFPGRYDAFISGGVQAGEHYVTAARRELDEELRITGARPYALFTHRYDGAELPQWIGVFELHWDGPVRPDGDEIAWSAFLPEAAVVERLAAWDFCPDTRDTLARYLRLKGG